jgi:hypothetical protein
MTFQQKLMAIASLAAIIAAVVLARGSAPGASRNRTSSSRVDPVTAWLAVVAGSLLLVGVVSHTLLRHTVQIAPLVAALVVLLARRPAWGVPAAAPLFAFWLLLMIAIWLFLLGIARIVSGRFTSIEVALTIVIGVSSVCGLFAARRTATTTVPAARLATIVVFSVLQFAALLISALPSIGNR